MAIVLDGTTNTVTPLNGALGATTPSTVVATTITASGISTLIGNVGIGITPTLPLHVKGATSTGLNETLRISAGNTGVSGPSVGFHNYYNDNSYPTWKLGEIGALYSGGAEYQGALVFHTNTGSTATALTEKMRINSSGQLLINTTTPDGDTKVNAKGNNVFFADIAQTSGGGYNAKYTAGSGTAYFGYWLYGASVVGSISSTGTVTTYNTTSDYRLKENISPMLGALDTIAQLKPVTYTWKSNGSAGQGFIAHELQEVVPDCVIGEKDAINEDGSINPQGIDTSFLVATLTAAIQELNAKFEAYKASHP